VTEEEVAPEEDEVLARLKALDARLARLEDALRRP
jgi:hypothetical protein